MPVRDHHVIYEIESLVATSTKRFRHVRSLCTTILLIASLSTTLLLVYYMSPYSRDTTTMGTLSDVGFVNVFDINNPSHVLLYIDIPFCTDSRTVLDHLHSDISGPYPCHMVDDGRAVCERFDGAPWLISSKTRDLPCGNLPSFSGFTQCLTESNRTYFFATTLCDPITRFISEYRHLEDLRTNTFWRMCNSWKYREEENCLYSTNLEEFLSCPQNPATNRMTRLLADSSCNIGVLNKPPIADYILQSALLALQTFNFVAVQEYPLSSNLLFEETFEGMTLSSPIPGVSQPHHYYNISKSILRRIARVNKYDVMLYHGAIRQVAAQMDILGRHPSRLDDVMYPTGIPGPYDGLLEYYIRNRVVLTF